MDFGSKSLKNAFRTEEKYREMRNQCLNEFFGCLALCDILRYLS